MKKNQLLITTILLFLSLNVSAQRRSSISGGKRYNSHKRSKHHKPVNYINNIKGSFLLGGSKYNGDIAITGNNALSIDLAVGVGGSYRYNERFSFHGTLNYVGLSGDDADNSYIRNLSFYTHVVELNTGVTWDFVKYNKMYRRRAMVTPYANAGLGLIYFTPTAELDGKNYALADYQTEGVDYSRIAALWYLGGGLRLKATAQLDISLEAMFRFTFTDYIDDLSQNYADDLGTTSDQIRQALSMRMEGRTYEELAGGTRGGPDVDDIYFVMGIRAEYTFRVTKQRYSLKRNTSKFRMHKGIRKK
jgi:hypothetical protein